MDRILYSKEIVELCDICIIDGEVVKDRGTEIYTIVEQSEKTG